MLSEYRILLPQQQPKLGRTKPLTKSHAARWPRVGYSCFTTISMVNGQWFIVSYDSANKQKHHKSHRMQ